MRTIATMLLAAALLTGCTDTQRLPTPAPQAPPTPPGEGS